MGCAAVCGSSSSVAENNKEWETLILTLLASTKPNLYLYPSKQLASFKKQVELTPHKLTLIVPSKLEQNNPIPCMITEKWKILLYTLDLGRSKYIECLGYSHLVTSLHEQLHTNTLMPNNQEKICEKNNSEQSESSHSNVKEFPFEILPHKVFSQISKDIERSFPHVQFNHDHFANILKRIANAFPVMGYTQGINFIVGYFLILGYSEVDSYYLFLHLALNHRYLILGLYEDNFPLINIYISIFRNILRRTNEKLYNHLYHEVEMLQESIWVFKWFMTLYLSSFPMEMCMYVFDFLLCTDSTALIKFAIGLVTELENELMGYDDACDIAEFFDGMKQIERFNELVDIRRVFKAAHEIKIEREDLEGMGNMGSEAKVGGENLNNFYSEYVGARFGEALEENTRTADWSEEQDKKNDNSGMSMENKTSVKKSVSLLDAWYSNLTKERLEFFNTYDTNISKENTEPFEKFVQPPITNLKESIIIPEHPGSPPKSSSPSGELVFEANLSGKMNINIEEDVKLKLKTSFSRCSIKKYVKEESMSVWQSEEEDQYKEENQDKIHMEQQLFKMPKDIRFKRKKGEDLNDILSEYSNPEQSQTKMAKSNYSQSRHEIIPRTDEFLANKNIKSTTRHNQNIHNSNTCSRLAYVGNSIISNLSASNSNRSSTSSHKVNREDLENIRNLQKENEGGRNIKTKIRTEENSLGCRNYQIEKNEESPDTNLNARKRLSTYTDWMINSLGPQENNNNLASSNVKQISDAGSEVEIKGVHMFKKKNRINIDEKERKKEQDKIYGPGIIQQKHGHGSESKFEYKKEVKGNGFNDEESYESFFIGNASSRKSEICEVESVK